MLKQMLMALDSGRVQSHAQLARRLDISEGMVAHLIEDLVRRGYLTPAETTETHGGCPFAGGGAGHACTSSRSCAHCTPGAPALGKRWVLTEKGQRMTIG